MMKHHTGLRALKPVITACHRILNALGTTNDANRAVVNSCHVGVKYQYSTGLSLYFPFARVEEIYYSQPDGSASSRKEPIEAFARATGWGDFISRYVELSRRPPRKGTAEKDLPEMIALLRHDPPEGRGFLAPEYDTAKNPPLTWDVSGCVIKPLLNS